MTRGTALVTTIEQVMHLTGVQGLSGVESADFVEAQQLVTASDAIYDLIEAGGIDPTTLTNAEVYQRAIAWYFVGQCYLAGRYVALPEQALPAPDVIARDGAYAWAEPYFKRVHGKTSGDDDPRHAAEGLPIVLNLEQGQVYSDGLYVVEPDPSRWRDW